MTGSREELDLAREQVLERTAALEALVRERLATARTTIDRALCEPIENALGRAAGAHRELAARLAGHAADAGSDSVWLRSAGYRDDVASRVLQPMHECFEKLAVAGTVAEPYTRLADEVLAAIDSEENDVLLPEADDLYQPRAGDLPFTRIGKAAVRGRRRGATAALAVANLVRSATGGERREPVVRTRSVPLRSLVAYHLQTRVTRVMAGAAEEQQQRIARVAADFEDAVTTWTHAVLEIVATVERPEQQSPHHEPQPDSAPESDGGEPEGDAPVTAVEKLAVCATELQAALERIAPERGSDSGTAEELREAFVAFERDLERAGTFMLSPDRRRPPERTNTVAMLGDRSAVWDGWHRQVLNRFALLERVIRLQDELAVIENEALTAIAGATLDPIATTFGALRERLREGGDEAGRIAAKADGSRAEVAGQYRALGDRTSRAIKQVLRDLPGIVASDRALSAPASDQWHRLQELIATLPESYEVHPVIEDGAKPVSPDRSPMVIGLRQITRDALDPPLPDQLKQPAASLRQRIPQVWGETEQVLNIVQYNFSAAAEELESEGEMDQATELAGDGIRRAIETLGELEESLAEPWAELARAVRDTFRGDWTDLHRRVRADAVLEEKWVGIRTRAERGAEAMWHALQLWWRRRVQVGRRWVLRGRVLVVRWVQRGRSAVSTAGAGEQQAYEALAPIVAVDAVVEELPLVYRRLFSFAALKEPALYTGRERELERLRAHFAAWREGRNSGVAVVPGAPGSGRTSFLNVIQSKVFAESEVRVVTLAERIEDEGVLAGRLIEALGMELPPGCGLRQVETELINRRPAKRPLVCLVDNLEHLMIRAPGGTDLLEQVLLFFSRTDSAVYWTATVSRACWTFVARSVPEAVASVAAYPFESFDRDTLERIVVNRHERSGMSLEFATPSNPSPLLRRRLRRAIDPARREAILRESYFDQLHRLSGTNISLALFYWIRSADFETTPDTLIVNAIEPFDFRLLNALDLQQTFSLQAFVMHNTLTLEEHNRVLHVSDDTGRFVLESLVRLRLVTLVQPETRDSREANDLSITGGKRYTLRRLALHPVTELLQKRNVAT